MKAIICFRGKKDVWLNFALKLKKEGKEVWGVLEPFIKDYLKKK